MHLCVFMNVENLRRAIGWRCLCYSDPGSLFHTQKLTPTHNVVLKLYGSVSLAPMLVATQFAFHELFHLSLYGVLPHPKSGQRCIIKQLSSTPDLILRLIC